MGEKKELSEVEANILAGSLVKKLDKLSIGQARWVLNEAENIIMSTQRISTAGPLFRSFSEELKLASAEEGKPLPK